MDFTKKKGLFAYFLNSFFNLTKFYNYFFKKTDKMFAKAENLSIYFTKVVLIHANPSARLSIGITLNSSSFYTNSSYKACKETRIADILTFPFNFNEKTMKIQIFLLFNREKKIIGNFTINFSDFFDLEGEIDINEKIFSDENTEKTYQPKLFFHLFIEKAQKNVEEDSISPKFNYQAENTKKKPIFRENNDEKFKGEFTIKTEDFSKKKPLKRLKNDKYNTKRSITPNPTKGFIYSLAIGYVALLRNKNISNYKENLSKSVVLNKNSGISDEFCIKKQENSFEIVEENRVITDKNVKKIEKVKKSTNIERNFNENQGICEEKQMDNEEIEEKELQMKLGVFERENEKLKENNAKLVELLKKTHNELFFEEKPEESGGFQRKKTEKRPFPELLKLETANFRLKEAVIIKENEKKLKKKEISAIFEEIAKKQEVILKMNSEIFLIKKEFFTVNSKKKPLENRKFLEIRKKNLVEFQKEFQDNFQKELSEITDKITKEKHRNGEFDEIYRRNIEENELENEEITKEKGVFRIKVLELTEMRDFMRKSLMNKDEKINELEKIVKKLNILLVKVKEEKAAIINAIFERENCDILEEIERKNDEL